MEEIQKTKKINYIRIKSKKTSIKIYIQKIILITSLLVIILSLNKYYPGFLSFMSLINIFKISSSYLSVCLCVIAKKENLYAKEFVNHYKN